MKGKFKTKVLGFLGNPLVAGAVKMIPGGIGSLAANWLDNLNGTKAGEIDRRTIAPIVIKILIYAALGVAAAKGWLTLEDVEVIKDQISPL